MHTPELELMAAGRRIQVPGGRPFVIGRGPTVDLDLPGAHVSRTHLVVELTAGGWTLTDHSRYGTFAAGRRVTTMALTGPTVVHLGSPPDVTALEFRPVAAVRPPTPQHSG
ncbi:MAG: FHA domain-containing protein, partial [Pseudonocardia sp.]|nr:FHA domain-containing protein [Pseudonocardia sp.]